MVGVLKATDVRNNFGQFFDDVVRVSPQAVKRNRDTIFAFSLEQLRAMLATFRFKVDYDQEDNGSFSGAVTDFDLVANANTVDELKRSLAQELIEYAQEYIDEYPLYSRAPNRRAHVPWVINVLVQPDLDAVVGLIDA